MLHHFSDAGVNELNLARNAGRHPKRYSNCLDNGEQRTILGNVRIVRADLAVEHKAEAPPIYFKPIYLRDCGTIPGGRLNTIAQRTANLLVTTPELASISRRL